MPPVEKIPDKDLLQKLNLNKEEKKDFQKPLIDSSVDYVKEYILKVKDWIQRDSVL